MKDFFYIVATLGIISALLMAAVAVKQSSTQPPVASVAVSSEYTATSTTSADAGQHGLLRGSLATFGSVTVASSSATTLTLWNATSTTDVSSTTITTLKASIAEGTYTFDVVANRGLIVEVPTGFNGDYVVTYR